MSIQVEAIYGRNIISNTYILYNESATFIVDPSVQLSEIKKLVTSPVVGVLLTHAHADHMIHLKEVISEYQCPIYCHKAAIEKIENDELNVAHWMDMELNLKFPESTYHILHDGSIISLGEDKIHVLGTPGHTNCSLIFQFADQMITGDTIFYHSIGRTDLYSGNSAILINTLTTLKNLKGDFVLWPGHGIKTTLEEERKNNPYLIKLSKV